MLVLIGALTLLTVASIVREARSFGSQSFKQLFQ